MHLLDWGVLVLTLSLIVFYGIWKSRHVRGSENYLAGQHDLRWWTIGLSIMATQASAITFLSTPGQAYADGMQFVQFYFGMPLAMIFLALFVLPIYYRLHVTTAYEYLEQRFDLRMRALAAFLFLIQRGVAAAISIYAPSIIFCVVFGWNLAFTNFLMAIFVVVYTTTGGSAAVSRTQELQMTVMLAGLMLAFGLALHNLPEHVGLTEAWQIAGATSKTQVIDWKFDWDDRYNIWSGLLGSTFLFLSYFGTDQSQVGRYLSGKTLRESRFGLLFNGFIKIPMQFLVLSVGVMVFVFYQFGAAPLNFNPNYRALVEKTPAYQSLRTRADSLSQARQATLNTFSMALNADNTADADAARQQLAALDARQNQLRFETKALLYANDPKADPQIAALKNQDEKKYRSALESAYKDTDYVFINFVLGHIPVGLVGLILAMIFCASWSTTASELSALTATSVSDVYRRMIAPGRSDRHYLHASRWATVLWGIFIMAFATYADLFDNLIQAVNMIGSVFYGTILGIFLTAFFLKKVGSRAVFWAAVIGQAVVIFLFFFVDKDAYLWYNPLGCGLVMGLAWLIQQTTGKTGRGENSPT